MQKLYHRWRLLICGTLSVRCGFWPAKALKFIGEDFYARGQHLLPLSNETRLHVIREQLLSTLPLIKENVVTHEAKNSPDCYVVDFSGLEPLPARAPFERELRKYSTTVSEIVS